MNPATFFGGASVFILGAIFGSFANVLVIRMKESSSLWGRSRCVHCKTIIRPHHLVPLVSWFVLGGRCADCGNKIHVQYPLVEALAALLALITFFRHDFFADPVVLGIFLFEFVFLLDLLVLVAFDLRWRLLPVEFMIGSALVFAIWQLTTGAFTFSSVILGMAVGGGFLGVQVLISRGKWMGMGDPWAGALIGAALGWPMIAYALYATYIVGGMVALFLFLSGLAKRGTRVPFAPFLASGALMAIWFGPWMKVFLR